MNKKIMWPLALVLSLGCIYFLSMYFIKKQYQVATTTQLILMCIDETEPSPGWQIDAKGKLIKTESLGASGVDLLSALYQEECIIIVTSSVVSYVMRYIQEVSPSPLGLEPVPSINPQNWIKKKVSDYLYILIPKKYIETRSNYKNLKNSDKYRAEELAVGIAFASKDDISDKDFMRAEYHKKNTDYPEKYELDYIGEFKTEFLTSRVSEHVIKNLENIFIPFSAYLDQKNVPQTTFLLFGHGTKYTSIDERITIMNALKKDTTMSPEFKEKVDEEIEKLENLKKQGEKAYHAGRIAGLQGKDFGAFVCYIQNNLRVPLLFTSTCFGAEINLEKALKDSINDESSNCKEFNHLSFPIISGALSSAVAMGGYTMATLNENNKMTIFLKRPDYKRFFEALLVKNDNTDELFFEALQYIYLFYEKYESFNNIPSIKYPGKPWRPLNIPKITVTLDDELIKNAIKGDTLDISPYFITKKKPKLATAYEPPPLQDFFSHKFEYPNVLFITKADIPFELVVSGKEQVDLPAFLSHIPGDAVHHFTKINASTYSLSHFLDAFFTIHDLYDTKTFIIDELSIKNDLTILPYKTGNIITLHHVILQNKPIFGSRKLPQKSVFFEADHKEWAAENINMGNPVAFAIQPLKKSGAVKKILDELSNTISKES